MFDAVDGLLALVAHPYVLLAVCATVAAAAGLWSRYDHHRCRIDHRRLLSRPGVRPMRPTTGLHDSVILPVGDRRNGARWGVSQDSRLPVAGRTREVTVSAFEWWWEERGNGRGSQRRVGLLSAGWGGHAPGTVGTYSKATALAVVIELPVRVPAVILEPTTVVGRAGLARRGMQVESDEFNRRFEVLVDDEREAVGLLDARMQATLASHFEGRRIEFFGSHVVILGDPDHRDGSLHGTVGKLPALLEDARRLARALPASMDRSAPDRG